MKKIDVPLEKATKHAEFEFTTSAMLCSWKCVPCEYEFAILSVSHCVDGDGDKYDQVSNWGNPDRPPFCPRCGSKDKVSR